MMLIDTHCHLGMEEFSGDLDSVIKRANKNGVEKIITIACSLEEAHQALALTRKYESVYAAIGLHPGNLVKETEEILDDLEKIEDLAKKSKVVAIGEIGLDYRGLENDDSKQKQKEFFLRQLSIAERLKKPAMIHCRNAYNDLITLLKAKTYSAKGDISSEARYNLKPNLKGVVHCFSGRLSQAKKLLDLGFFISFTGVIAYARDYDNVIKEIPLERLLLETDAPFLAPTPYRGQRNEPAYVVEIAKKIAEIKGISFEEVALKTSRAAEELFKI